MDIIAQEFKTAGNIGALARAMKNFGFTNLKLLNPKADHLSKESIDRSTHAKDLLEKAEIISELNYDTIIGTTSILGSDYNLRRNSLTPEEFAKLNLEGTSCLIIGREGDGLTNEELDECDILVTIPSSLDCKALNVSHAAAVILYEIFKHSNKEKLGDKTTYASREEKDKLMELLQEKIKKMAFINEYKEQTQILVWKKLIGKSNLTKREAMALFGFLKKI